MLVGVLPDTLTPATQLLSVPLSLRMPPPMVAVLLLIRVVAGLDWIGARVYKHLHSGFSRAHSRS